MDEEKKREGTAENRMPYHIEVPAFHQARFTMVAAFRESTSYTRNYRCPFNMLGVCTRSEGENASIVRNLLTGEEYSSRVDLVTMCPCNLPQRYTHTLRKEHLAIHFKLELFPGVDVFAGQKHVIKEFSPSLTAWAKEIFAISEPTKMLTACQEFALHFSLRHWPERYGFELKEMEKFQSVLTFIRNKANGATSVKELAALMDMPESTFCRAFHKVFNMPPKEFLQQEIFRKAAQLLLMPGMTVRETAMTLGFSSEFYFSHFFKRQSNLAPRTYQEQHDLLK